jgi:hypothetical protein
MIITNSPDKLISLLVTGIAYDVLNYAIMYELEESEFLSLLLSNEEYFYGF